MLFQKKVLEDLVLEMKLQAYLVFIIIYQIYSQIHTQCLPVIYQILK